MLYSSCLYAFNTSNWNKFLDNLIMIIIRAEYPHQYAKPLLNSIFKVSDFKTLTKKYAYISVSIQTQHSQNKLVSRMVADYPNPCEFFKEMMLEFYSDRNLIDNKYRDITLTFDGFSPEIVRFLHTQDKNTSTHKFFFDKEKIVIVLNQDFFINNNQLLKDGFKYCSMNSGQRLLAKAEKWFPPQLAYPSQTVIQRHAAIAEQNRFVGKIEESSSNPTTPSPSAKEQLPPSLPANKDSDKTGPVQVKTNR